MGTPNTGVERDLLPPGIRINTHTHRHLCTYFIINYNVLKRGKEELDVRIQNKRVQAIFSPGSRCQIRCSLPFGETLAAVIFALPKLVSFHKILKMPTTVYRSDENSCNSQGYRPWAWGTAVSPLIKCWSMSLVCVALFACQDCITKFSSYPSKISL